MHTDVSQAADSRSLHTRKMVAAAMFAALILLATSVLKIQTPAFGYIHIGDAFVLLAGICLGPGAGALAAGIGSALSDLLGGYAIWVPGSFLIKFCTALTAAVLFRFMTAKNTTLRRIICSTILSGICGEAVMVVGYFFYNILIIFLTGGSMNSAGWASAAAVSIADIPFNLIQGIVGILLATILIPLFRKITTLFSR